MQWTNRPTRERKGCKCLLLGEGQEVSLRAARATSHRIVLWPLLLLRFNANVQSQQSTSVAVSQRLFVFTREAFRVGITGRPRPMRPACSGGGWWVAVAHQKR